MSIMRGLWMDIQIFLKEFFHVSASCFAIIKNVDSDSLGDFQFTAASEPIFLFENPG